VMALTEGPVPAPEAIERAEEMLRHGFVDRQAEAVALLALAPLYAMSGEFERARELADRAEDLLRDAGGTVLAARTSDASARIELMAGNPQAAESRLRADYEALHAMDERYFLPNIAALLAKTLDELGLHDEAEQLAEAAAKLASPDDVEAQALLRVVQARVLAARGRPGDAYPLAREALELIGQTDAPVLRADTLLDLADVLEASPGEGIAALEEALSLYQRKRHLVGIARVEAALAERAALA
jgi:tetratricopeptide (TPR) repeat protein